MSVQHDPPAPSRRLRILFLTVGLPGHSLEGYRVRAYHQLQGLAEHHDITLVSFIGPNERAEALAPVASACRRVVTVPLRRSRMTVGLLRAGISGLPFQTGLYEAPAMRRAIRDELKGAGFDLAHVQLARMAPYLDEVSAVPRVVDLVDALSLNMKRRSQHEAGLWRWLTRVEATRLERYERKICASVDRAVIGSALDRAALGSPPNLSIVTSGVDLDAFSYERAGRRADTVILSGRMSYFPNVQAALWFGRRVLPIVERARPGIEFHVVGARPDPAILRLARRRPRIRVSGFVERVAPRLRAAAVAVAPMRAGSGQQLKILEAMASGTPVVATSLAAAGVEALHGEHLLVADEPEAFAGHVIRLLNGPALADHLAANARRLVEERYTWAHSVRQLEAIYSSVAARRPSTA